MVGHSASRLEALDSSPLVNLLPRRTSKKAAAPSNSSFAAVPPRYLQEEYHTISILTARVCCDEVRFAMMSPHDSTSMKRAHGKNKQGLTLLS